MDVNQHMCFLVLQVERHRRRRRQLRWRGFPASGHPSPGSVSHRDVRGRDDAECAGMAVHEGPVSKKARDSTRSRVAVRRPPPFMSFAACRRCPLGGCRPAPPCLIRTGAFSSLTMPPFASSTFSGEPMFSVSDLSFRLSKADDGFYTESPSCHDACIPTISGGGGGVSRQTAIATIPDMGSAMIVSPVGKSLKAYTSP